jgi:hypothetical protein
MVNCVKMTNLASEWTKDVQYSIHFTVLKENLPFFFLAVSLQTDAKVHEYVRVRQCHSAFVIEQTYAVILHMETPAASC